MSADPAEPKTRPDEPPAPRAADSAASANLPAAVPPWAALPPSPDEEVEVWWGGCSGWILLPSFVVCLALTGLGVWVSWHLVPRHLLRLTAVTIAAVIWGVQLLRLGARVFGWTYRLTTRRLLLARGVRRMDVKAVELTRIRRVTVERSGLERLTGLGRILVTVEGEPEPRVLAGVRNPHSAAETIRLAVEKATLPAA
ncbi:MAG: PH domain-containing protein [Gemmataceae bacterium]|nr:PH domain-containing protein [Gemmataceae bacterium]